MEMRLVIGADDGLGAGRWEALRGGNRRGLQKHFPTEDKAGRLRNKIVLFSKKGDHFGNHVLALQQRSEGT
jgi:hypothetical protein